MTDHALHASHGPTTRTTPALADADDEAGAHDRVTIELDDLIESGARVEVRRRFDQAWATGFEVASAGGDGYRLRRRSDGAVLPVAFPAADVRRSGALRLPD